MLEGEGKEVKGGDCRSKKKGEYLCMSGSSIGWLVPERSLHSGTTELGGRQGIREEHKRQWVHDLYVQLRGQQDTRSKIKAKNVGQKLPPQNL